MFKSIFSSAFKILKFQYIIIANTAKQSLVYY